MRTRPWHPCDVGIAITHATELSTYEIAGIHDVDEFATERYVGGPPGLDLERSLDAFDIRRGKVLWIYHNIKAGSSVLDFGCGVGRLAVLGRKNCKLYGIETSIAAAQRAEQVGYTQVLVGDLEQLLQEWGGRRFDYVVSLTFWSTSGRNRRTRSLPG